MGKVKSSNRRQMLKVLAVGEMIVEIADVRIICFVQNEITGKLTKREISLGFEAKASRKKL